MKSSQKCIVFSSEGSKRERTQGGKEKGEQNIGKKGEKTRERKGNEKKEVRIHSHSILSLLGNGRITNGRTGSRSRVNGRTGVTEPKKFAALRAAF